jgi:hypothetical protein
MTPPPDELVIGNSWGGRILIVELLLQVDTLPEAAAQHEALGWGKITKPIWPNYKVNYKIGLYRDL